MLGDRASLWEDGEVLETTVRMVTNSMNALDATEPHT